MCIEVIVCNVSVVFLRHSVVQRGQEALLLQRDSATCLSVEILQLQNIPFVESWDYRVALFV